MSDVQALKLKRDKLKKIELLKRELPHLYGFPLYTWQQEFMDETCPFQFIFKANQIGGSSIMIKKMIRFCTDKSLWTTFARTPRLTMYLYPEKKTSTREWETKWQEFMPNGSMKDDPVYGWKETWDGNYIDTIEWNSGLITYFKTYAAGAETMQGSTIAIVACDEELPEVLWPELQTRVTGSPANKGAMYWQGCTPTIGQKYLADIQSGVTKLPGSRVWTISQYDCLFYSNGERSMWTKEHIEANKQRLPSQREVDVRIYGLFKPLDKLAITQFNKDRHVKPWHPIKGWDIYAGIDYGVGGATGHPPSITFVAVSPAYTAARTLKVWRGNYGPGAESYTHDDVIMKYLELMGELGTGEIAETNYDPAAAGIGVIAERSGLNFTKANKDRDNSFGLINSLFKNDMLILLDDGKDDTELLIEELETVTTSFDKKRAGDDCIDSLRYALSKVPFNFENIKIPTHDQPVKTLVKTGRERGEVMEDTNAFDDVAEEIDEWNDCYG